MVTLFMSPILLMQAIWVRAKVIKLPEASGPRSGSQGEGKTIKLLILGDSAAAGVGVYQQTEALSGQLSAQLAMQYHVNWQLIATSGLTSSQVCTAVNTLSPQSFDFVVLSVGVNDVTHLTAAKVWQDNLNTLLTLLSTKFSAQVLITHIPPMHLFTGIPQPLRFWLGKRAQRLNQLMATAVDNHQQSRLLNLTITVLPENLAEDGIHPSKLTYQQWGQQAAHQIIRLKQGIE
jgi:lysophospholipase L1-like esterase